jgi:hypothetical protein
VFTNTHLFTTWQELGCDKSVLQAHYARNRTPKAPNPSRIRRAPPATVPPPLPPPRGTPNNAPRTLSSYPPHWQEVISYAKLSFRSHVAGTDGFPDALTGVEQAKECLEDALAVHLEERGVVEPGKSSTSIQHTPSNPFVGYVINQEMVMLVSRHSSKSINVNKTVSQVYAESWLLRSQIKADIRTQVRNLSSLFPVRFAGTPEELQSHIRDTVRKLVGDGSYLHETTPDSVRTTPPPTEDPTHMSQDDQVHFGHPIIASTTKLFYFDKWRDISTQDRDTFRGSVPKPLVALIGTVVGFP